MKITIERCKEIEKRVIEKLNDAYDIEDEDDLENLKENLAPQPRWYDDKIEDNYWDLINNFEKNHPEFENDEKLKEFNKDFLEKYNANYFVWLLAISKLTRKRLVDIIYERLELY